VSTALFVAQMSVTLAMTGIIWMVQVVHYPLFSRVGAASFMRYHDDHTRRITYVVAPLMLAEAVAASYMLFDPPAFFPSWAARVGTGLVVVVWASTFLGQVPVHGVLRRGFDPTAHATLVVGNWIRTVGWSARAVLLVWFLTRALETVRM